MPSRCSTGNAFHLYLIALSSTYMNVGNKNNTCYLILHTPIWASVIYMCTCILTVEAQKMLLSVQNSSNYMRPPFPLCMPSLLTDLLTAKFYLHPWYCFILAHSPTIRILQSFAWDNHLASLHASCATIIAARYLRTWTKRCIKQGKNWIPLPQYAKNWKYD